MADNDCTTTCLLELHSYTMADSDCTTACLLELHNGSYSRNWDVYGVLVLCYQRSIIFSENRRA